MVEDAIPVVAAPQQPPANGYDPVGIVVNQRYIGVNNLMENPYESPQSINRPIPNKHSSWVWRMGILRWCIVLSYFCMLVWCGLARHVMRPFYVVDPNALTPDSFEYMDMAMYMTAFWGALIGLIAFVTLSKWFVWPYFFIVSFHFMIYFKNIPWA